MRLFQVYRQQWWEGHSLIESVPDRYFEEGSTLYHMYFSPCQLSGNLGRLKPPFIGLFHRLRKFCDLFLGEFKPLSCWSPNIPEIGVPWSFEALRFPYISALEQTFGSAEIGIPKKLQRSSSHSRLLILKSIVRDAFDTSVTWFPVNFHKSHESTVPTIALPSRNLDAFRGFSNLAPENSILTHKIQIIKNPCLFWVHYP